MHHLLWACLVLFVLVTPLRGSEPDKKAKTAMSVLNRSFIGAHAAARKQNLATGGPVILLRSGQLVLIRDGKEQAVDVFPDEYDTFKVFAHLPAAIYLMLGPQGVGELDAERIEQLHAYRKKMDLVGERIEDIGLKGPDLARQRILLTESKRFLDGVVKKRRVSWKELYGYTLSMTPLIKVNLAGAAAAQINGMHRQMMAWKEEMTASEWKKLRVAIKDAVLARDGNLAKQYFQHLLNLKDEGVRLVYMEIYYPPTPMETLLATRTVDRGLGIAFFGDPDRMFRDVLADAATAYLEKNFSDVDAGSWREPQREGEMRRPDRHDRGFGRSAVPH